MFLTALRSKPHLDREAESSVGDGWARGAEAADEYVHTHFSFEDYPGDPPHARVSIAWADVEALITRFADKGHPVALRLLSADKLAGAVEELTKNTNRPTPVA
ncbi:MAG: hypothetical protein U1E20_02775 [Methylocystis sp.]|uniref:hypothetical protein n=1 Tax=Methylocystis sp. TaxID=1911079 RepID=UPI00392828C3